MEASLRSDLLTLVDAYVAHRGSSRAAVSKLIFNDNTFFGRIAEGKNFTVRSFDRAVEWFSAGWPADLPWPPGSVRTTSSSIEEAA